MPLALPRPALVLTFTILATLARFTFTFTFTCTPPLADPAHLYTQLHPHLAPQPVKHLAQVFAHFAASFAALSPSIPRSAAPIPSSLLPVLLPVAITSNTYLRLVTVWPAPLLYFFLLRCAVSGLSLLRICFPRPFALVFVCSQLVSVCVCVCAFFAFRLAVFPFRHCLAAFTHSLYLCSCIIRV